MHDLFPATQCFLHRLQEQSSVRGVFLLGSKSRGYADQRSDDDLEVLLTEDVYGLRTPQMCVEQIYDQNKRLNSDIRYTTLAHVCAKIDSPIDTDHWPYERAKVLYDRDGQVHQVVEPLGGMNVEFRRKRLWYATTSLTIALGKIGKAKQRGYEISGLLALVRAARAFSRVLFALEWRWCPPDHWLEMEIQTLNDLTQAGPCLLVAVKEQRIEPLREALQRLEDVFPNDVPGREQRAILYRNIMHPDSWVDRSIHMLL